MARPRAAAAPEQTFPVADLGAALAAFRRPFTPAAIKVKPQTKPNARNQSLVTFYIDGRLAAERLNTVVGAAAWSDEYRVLSADPNMGLPIECRLTVLGVHKTDVGQIEPKSSVDEKAWKSVYSDAFKRACVKFGVGVFLYNLPNVWAEVKIGQNGKAQGFTPAGTKAALDAYRQWLASGIYGEPLDHGDPDREPEPEPVAQTNGNGKSATDVAEIERLIAEINDGKASDGLPLTEAQLRDWMQEKYGTTVSAELSAEAATEFLARLKHKAGV